MEEVTIKVNKTVLMTAAGLILGVILGFGGAKLTGTTTANSNNNAVVAANTNTDTNTDNAGDTAAAPNVTITSSDHLRGAKNAKVVLVEYSDFQCPYCKQFDTVMKQVMTNYGTKVAWVYRHFPLSFHANAQIAAEASECASEQGKFWEMADIMFSKGQSNGTGLAQADLETYAKNLGLNTSKFSSCLTTNKYASVVSADQATGSANGVNGTPGTILIDKNGKQQLISGAVPYAQLAAYIDAALK